jgi:hypothetical protein
MLLVFLSELQDNPELLDRCEEDPSSAPLSYTALSDGQKVVLRRRDLAGVLTAASQEIRSCFSNLKPVLLYPHADVDYSGLGVGTGAAGQAVEIPLSVRLTLPGSAGPIGERTVDVPQPDGTVRTYDFLDGMDVSEHFDGAFALQGTGTAAQIVDKHGTYTAATSQVDAVMKVVFPAAGSYDLTLTGEHFDPIEDEGAFEAS